MSVVIDSPDWTSQQANLDQSGIVTWLEANPYPGAIYLAGCTVYEGTIYVTGGVFNGAQSNQVRYCKLNTDGTMGAWLTATNLPVTLQECTAAVFNEFLYVLGGVHGVSQVATVYRAPINDDGSLGAWSVDNPLLAVISDGVAICINNFIYYFGGYQIGVGSLNCYYALINIDGTIGTWKGTSPLPAWRAYQGVVTYANRVYVVGGLGNSPSGATQYVSAVLVATLSYDGTLSTWSSVTSLPEAKASSICVIDEGTIYVAGGDDHTHNVAAVFRGSINNDGTINQWIQATDLPTPRSGSMGCSWNGVIYNIGGATNVGNLSEIVYAIV